MAGETDLKTLLAHMSPLLADGEVVYCTFPDARYGDHADLEPIAAIHEAEGLTLVVPRASADARGIAYESTFRRITLQVHSSLDAVGLTAAFARRLAEHGLSANVLAGFFHDHLLVQSDVADRAVEALGDLARSAGTD
ncbi:MAG: ACT domain-containing protein [Acidobacteriota bacterium]